MIEMEVGAGLASELLHDLGLSDLISLSLSFLGC